MTVSSIINAETLPFVVKIWHEPNLCIQFHIAQYDFVSPHRIYPMLWKYSVNSDQESTYTKNT
jgi:hypothetical protein